MSDLPEFSKKGEKTPLKTAFLTKMTPKTRYLADFRHFRQKPEKNMIIFNTLLNSCYFRVLVMNRTGIDT